VQVDVARDELLDNYENVLPGKGYHDHTPSCFSLAISDPLTDCCPRPVAHTYGEDYIQVQHLRRAGPALFWTYGQMDVQK
jgi:hypothetical protein